MSAMSLLPEVSTAWGSPLRKSPGSKYSSPTKMTRANSVAELARRECNGGATYGWSESANGFASDKGRGLPRRSMTAASASAHAGALVSFDSSPYFDDDSRVRRELRQLRHRNRELEGELISYSSTLQVAYWQEAQELLNHAIQDYHATLFPGADGEADGGLRPWSARDLLAKQIRGDEESGKDEAPQNAWHSETARLGPTRDSPQAAGSRQHAATADPAQLTATELSQIRSWYVRRIVDTERKLEVAQVEQRSARAEVQAMSAQVQSQLASSEAKSKTSATQPSPRPLPDAGFAPAPVSSAAERWEREHLEAELRQSRATHAAELHRERERAVEAEAGRRRVEERLAKVEAEVQLKMAKALDEQKHSLSGASTAQIVGLERQVVELQAAAEQQREAEEAKAREERVSLLHRQAMRRIVSMGLAKGWSAWVEGWEAKTHALLRLRECGHKLRGGAMSAAFAFWVSDHLERIREAEYVEQLRASNELEAQLRVAHYEMGVAALHQAANDDERTGLRQKVAELTDDMKRKSGATAMGAAARRELSELKDMYQDAKQELDEAEKRAALAQAELATTRQSSEELIRRLLDEQRRGFEAEIAELKRQLTAKTEAEQREARVEVLRKVAMRRILHAGLQRAWEAWNELCFVKHEAKALLRQVGSRMAVRGVGAAFTLWTRVWQAMKHYQLHATVEEKLVISERLNGQLQVEAERLAADVDTLRGQREKLQAKVMELSGGADDIQALLEEQASVAKAQRVEQFGRQAMRRLLFEATSRAFTTWSDKSIARRFAEHTLARTAQRLRVATLRDALAAWACDVEARRGGLEMHAMQQAEHRLTAELEALRAAYEKQSEEFAAKLMEAEAERLAALERQRVELAGTQEERAAMLEGRAKAERIETMRRYAGRRLVHARVADAWGAWLEFAGARGHAMRRLREVGGRLRRPEMSFAFGVWSVVLDEKRERERHAQLSELQKRELALEAKCARLVELAERARGEAEAKLAQAEAEKRIALDRQLVELTGRAEEIAAVRETEAKEARVELVRRQIGRRMMSYLLSRGFAAWMEMWEAKLYTVGRLREVGNKLRTPALAGAFSFWREDQLETVRRVAWQEVVQQSQSLEAQLRKSRYEIKQMGMVRAAHEDEIRALRGQLGDMSDEVKQFSLQLAEYAHLPEDVTRLRLSLDKADGEAREAVEKRELAEADVLRQLDDSQRLLERLLDEQREKLTAESKEVRRQLGEATEGRNALNAELSRLKDTMERGQKANDAHVAKLKEEIKKLTPPPPKPKEKPKPPKSWIDLDEGPGAPPVSAQLATALRENSTRVLDLFRSWDSDGDGAASCIWLGPSRAPSQPHLT